ncbi:hypothetical protein PROPEN_03535 [Proteus penneri ATCC 35198]|nr:hypothetical protein PROPEN_03535 [Proteus penneri ATCC 35198]
MVPFLSRYFFFIIFNTAPKIIPTNMPVIIQPTMPITPPSNQI